MKGLAAPLCTIDIRVLKIKNQHISDNAVNKS